MATDHHDATPGGPAYSYDPLNNHGARKPSWLAPAIRGKNPLQPKGRGDVTSQLGKSRSILDWLGQEDSSAAGKNLVPIRRPPLATHNGARIGPFGPVDTSSPAKGQNVALANDASQHDHTKNTRPAPQHPNASTQRTGATGADDPATNFAPYAPYSTPFPPRKPPSGNIGGPAVGTIQQQSESRSMSFDAVHDPSDPAKKDVIFKMSLPIEEDFQPNLGEFWRLRRLGRFKDAEKHFQHTLKHLSGVPYVLVQYCEMLLASGNYKSSRTVSYRFKYPSLDSEESVKDPCLDILEGNFWLLDLLAKVPQPSFDGDIFEALKRILGKLEAEAAMGSTEIQILVLSLTLLGHLEDCLGEAVTQRIKDHYCNQVFDWNQLYHRLLGEDRVWDLRDLLVAGVSLFGSAFLSQCLNVKSFSKALDQLFEDWIQPEYDESTALALLDLFTSILIDSPSSVKDEPKPRSLLEYSKSLVELIQTHDPQNMKSRPFIQWIIAKSISEMGDIPERPDGLRLRDFSGTIILPGRGIHLPVYIPAKPWDKPHWDMFSVRSSHQQRQSLHTALQAARYLGDYRLQAICLKLLILHTQEPKVLMDSLASLQLEQGDNEGFLETCLSKYMTLSGDESARTDLVNDFKKLDSILPGSSTQILPGLYNSNSFCEPKASLLWARDVVTRLLTDQTADDDEGIRFLKDNINFWNVRLTDYGPRLPTYLVNHIQKSFGAEIPQQVQAPLPPSPEQAQLPYGPSAVSGQPGRSFPSPKPQIPQPAPFEMPKAGPYPENEATHYGNPYHVPPSFYPHSFDPFYFPNVRPHIYPQSNPFAPPTFMKVPPPPPTEYDLPGSTTGQEVPRLPTDHIPPHVPPLYPGYPGHPSGPPMSHMAPGYAMDYDSDWGYFPKAPKPLHKEDLVSAALPRKKKNKHVNPDDHQHSRRPPVRLLAQRHQLRRSRRDVDESSNSYDDELSSSLFDTESRDDFRSGNDSSPVMRLRRRAGHHSPKSRDDSRLGDDSFAERLRRASRHGDHSPVKKPEAPALSESEDASRRKSVRYDDYSAYNQEKGASDGAHQSTRIMSPTINVSTVGKQQNLKIVSDLSEENDVSIVMTNKAEMTKSKVYTIKNGVVTKRIVTDNPRNQESTSRAALDGIPIPNTRPRTKSQSSLQTVRPFRSRSRARPPPVFVDSDVPPGPSTTIHEEEEGEATDDKLSTMSGRVQKANKYMDRKTDKWFKDHNQHDNNGAGSSKPRRPSIVQPKPVRPAAPGSLAHAISTDEDTGDDGEDDRPQKGTTSQTGRREQLFTETNPKSRSATSEDYSDFGSNQAVDPSDSASISFDDGADTTEAEESSAPHSKEKGKKPDIGRRRRQPSKRQYGHDDEQARLHLSERERLAERLSSLRIRRPQPPPAPSIPGWEKPTAASTSQNPGIAVTDRRSSIGESEKLDGKYPQLDPNDSASTGDDYQAPPPEERLERLFSPPPPPRPDAPGCFWDEEEHRDREEQRGNKESKKAAVEEVTVEEVD